MKIMKKGFTLVELVIVIAVIAILTAVLIPTFGGIIESAQKSAILQEAIQEFKECYAKDMADGNLDGLYKLDSNGDSVLTGPGDGYYVVIKMDVPTPLYDKTFKNKYRVIYNGDQWHVYNVGDYQGGGGSGGPSGGGNNNNNNYTAVNMTEKDAKELFVYKIIATPTEHIEINQILSTKNKVTIPDTIEGIPVTIMNCGTYGSSNIREINLPKTIVEISEQAFMDFSTLESIYLYDGLEKIGDEAFKGCRNLVSFTIPASVTSIGKGVFSECSRLTTFYVDDKSEHYIDYMGAIYTIDETELVAWPAGNQKKEVTLPSKITTIKEKSFSGNEYIEKIEIPESVITIEKEAFLGCAQLLNMTIPNNVTTIGQAIFQDCIRLKEVTISSSGIGSTIPSVLYLFGSCGKDGHNTLEDCFNNRSDDEIKACLKNMNIYSNRFAEGTGFDIYFPVDIVIDGGGSIGSYAFWGCMFLENVTVASSVTYVGGAAFGQCTKIKTVTFEGPATFEGYVFEYSDSIEKLTIQPGTIFEETSHFAFVFGYTEKFQIIFNGTKDEWNELLNNSSDNFKTQVTTHILLVKCTNGDIQYSN